MPYTVWKDDKEIGQTNFELSPAGRKRIGMFLPNALGLTALPRLTSMLPALLAFEEMCRRRGLEVGDALGDGERLALDAFSDTPEGRAVISAAKHVAAVELRDSRGQTIAWESLMISDVRLFRDPPTGEAAGAEPCAHDGDGRT